MTISNNYTPTSVSGDGTTTVFSGNWPIFVSTYLKLEKVLKVAPFTRTTMVLGTDYNLTFNSSGWVATFISGAPANTVNVVGSRVVPPTQTLKYSTSSGFDGTNQEQSYDLLTAMVQGLQDQLLRVPQLAVGSALVGVLLGAPVANKALLWDPTGTQIITSTDDFNTIVTAAAASAAAALASQTAAASSASSAAAQAALALGYANSASASAATSTTQAGIATAQAVLASGYATAAAASAALAAGSLISTSTTSNAIGTGSKTWTVGTGLSIPAGGGPYVMLSQNGAPSNYNVGQVTAYNTSTGSLTVNVTTTNGSGTITAWNLSVSAAPGLATGALLIANNLSDLNNITTARTNIGPGLNGLTYAGTSINAANDAFEFFSAANSGVRKAAVQDIFRVIDGLTLKSTPVGADELVINDSANSFAPKKVLLSALGGSEVVFLGSATASSSASLNFPTQIASAYDYYFFVFKDLVNSASAAVWMRGSQTGGSSYISATNSYNNQITLHTLGGATNTTSGTAIGTATAMILNTSGVGNPSLLSGELVLVNPNGGAATNANWNIVDSQNGPDFWEGYGLFNFSGINAVQFLPSAGTFTSGTILMYGVKNT